MDNDQSPIERNHEAEGNEKIHKLMQKIDTTKYNIEVSEDIILDTVSDTHRDKLIEKNTQRQHAIGSMKKEIRDIEQTLKERGKEVST